jgi:hypothetical protein
MRTGPALDRRSNADARIGSGSAGLADCAVKGGVTRAIEDVAEFLDFAAREGFQRAQYAAAHTDGISDIAEHMLDRLVARVHVTKQFLCVASAGEQSLRRRLGVDARADEEKLRAAAERPEFARHACNPRSALPRRLFRQSRERCGATFVKPGSPAAPRRPRRW